MQALGALKGFDIALRLDDGSRPDVALWRGRDEAMFIGEAKHAEWPRDWRALGRLAKYLELCRRRPPGGAADIVAVCHPVSHGAGWASALGQLAADGLLAATEPRLVHLSVSEAVAWIACGGACGVDQFIPPRA